MPTVATLLAGTLKVLPKAVRSVGTVNSSSIKISDIVSSNTGNRIQSYTVSVPSSGNSPNGGNSERLRGQGIVFPTDSYTVTMEFRTPKDSIPSATKDNVRVGCNCAAYFFYFVHGNRANQANAVRAKGPRYKRLTPKPPHPGAAAETNPDKLPGMCKHLIWLNAFLQDKDFIN